MNFLKRLIQAAPERLQAKLPHFPVRNTALTLWDRFNQDSLSLTASSLTFTTVLGVVPFFAVMLALFTAFPLFQTFKDGLENWLVHNLIPTSISEPVINYLTQFSASASELGTMALIGLMFTCLSMIYTIDRTLNGIWRVRQSRPWTQRLMLYWSVLTVGPLAAAGSLAATSYAMAEARGWVGDINLESNAWLDLLPVFILVAGLTLIYKMVPNTRVRWGHALAGGVFAGLCLSIGRWGLGIYLSRIPTYSLIYGAFATVPILLIWIYTAWLIILLGAVVAAYLPALLAGVPRRSTRGGWQFQVALEVLQTLSRAKLGSARGRGTTWMARKLRLQEQQLLPVMETLQKLDWVALLQEGATHDDARWVLLIDPCATKLAPLVEHLLFTNNASTQTLWQTTGLDGLMLTDVFNHAHVAHKLARSGLRQATSAISPAP